jgi:5-methylcytosine-specific restriction endonuclease McrA
MDKERQRKLKRDYDFVRNHLVSGKCQVCGKDKTIGKLYCSYGCSASIRKKDNSKVICQICHKEFFVIPARKNTAKFCSRSCKWEHEKTKIGKLNPFWGKSHTLKTKKFLSKINTKHGNSSEQARMRQRPPMKKWKRTVFIRDNFTCRKCGAKSGYDGHIELEAHHIIPIRKLFKTKFEKHMYNIDNGITLCCPCHSLIPRGNQYV